MNAFEHFFNLSKIYGPIYTFWMSSTPFVIISDLKTANEGFLIKRNEIAGRVQIKFCQLKLKLILLINYNLINS